MSPLNVPARRSYLVVAALVLCVSFLPIGPAVGQTAYTLSIDDVSVVENNTTATFTVTLSPPAGANPVTVSYTTVDGTAVAPGDYTAKSGNLTFASGQSTQTIGVAVKQDSIDEGLSETFTVQLSGETVTPPETVTLLKGTGTGTIVDNDDPPRITAGSAAASEGDGTIAFNVTLSRATTATVTVDYTTTDGTATQPGDYLTASGTLTFAPLDTSETVTVTLTDDAVDEALETFTLDLSNPVYGTVTAAGAQGVGTISDDDGPPRISVANRSGAEGSVLTFTVTLDRPPAATVTVDWATADDRAVAPGDYTVGSGTLTFVPGDMSETFAVATVDDAIDEENETFLVNLSNPVNAVIGVGQGRGTINDNDAQPTVSIADASANEAAGIMTFTLTLVGETERDNVRVNYATADGTATQPGDYTASSGTVNFAPLEPSETFTVSLVNDALDEVDETFTVTLSGANRLTIGTGTATGTITDDDLPVASVNSPAGVNEAAGPITFTVTLDQPPALTATVGWSTADGTALAGSDYVASSGVLTFVPGDTAKTFTVPLIDDLDDEVDETFFVNLGGPISLALGTVTGTGTIQDNEGFDPPVASIDTPAGVDEAASTVTFTVTLDRAPTLAASVDWFTADGSAVSPSDYTGASGTLNFAVGDTSKTFTVAIVDDTTDEDDETFTVSLSNPSNMVIGTGTGSGTIQDNDGPPAIRIDNASNTGEAAGPMDFRVWLSHSSAFTITVDFATEDNTAVAPGDYAAASGTLTFAPGDTEETVSVVLVDDGIDEENESLRVRLSNPANATIADDLGQGTITDDDPAPVVSIDSPTATEAAGTITFTLTLDRPSERSNVRVNWATADGTALDPGDYTAASGTVNFAALSTTETITVTLVDDALNEADEDFTVTLSGANRLTIGTGTGTGTIEDDDVPVVSVDSPAAVVEGSAVGFTVSIDRCPAADVTVDYASADGTALAGLDYTAASGTLTFAAAGCSLPYTQAVSVGTSDDAIWEPTDQTFTLTLSNVSANAAIGANPGTGTIQDTPDTPTVTIAGVTGSEAAGTFDFAVTLSNPSDVLITVDYATADGTALAGQDYTAASGTVTFAPGDTAEVITVSILNDGTDEPDQSFYVQLSNPSPALALLPAGPPAGRAAGTIQDDDPAPVIDGDDPSWAENSASYSFTISLDRPSDHTVTVQWAGAVSGACPGSPLATWGVGGDVDYYVAGWQTATFAPGVTSQSVSFQAFDDGVDEPNEQFCLALQSPTNASIAGSGWPAVTNGTGTILDDDAPPTVSVDSPSVAENAGPMVFTVSLSGPSAYTVTVDWATADGTAGAPGDYTAATGTVTFGPGDTTETVSITLVNDGIDEPNETLTVTLSNPSNAGIGTGTGTGMILDDDSPPTVSIDSPSALESAGTLDFTVSLSAASGYTVTVDWATADGTAGAPGDYTAATGTVTFVPGDTTETVSITLVNDGVDEPNETLTVTLSNPSNAGIGTSPGTGTILDDEPTPTVSIDSPSGLESGGPIEFTVTLSGPSAYTVTVDWATADGTAAAPGDYTAASGTVTFLPGNTFEEISVAPVDDGIDEPNETFTVTLSNPSNAGIGTSPGTGTIVDDEAAPTVSIDTPAPVPEAAGPAVFTVTLSGPSAFTVTVDWATADGTATAPGDYTAATGTVTFLPGDTSETVSVAVVADATYEPGPDQTFTVSLSNPANAVIGTGTGTGSIVDDDGPPAISIVSGSALEGAGSLGIAVILSRPADVPVTVDWVTQDNTAVSPDDYTASSGTVTFAPGVTTQTIVVPLVDDNIDEPNETFRVQLSNPTNATIAGLGRANGTIRDNDGTPTITIIGATWYEHVGALQFPVLLSRPSSRTVTVDFTTLDWKATAPADYLATSGRVTFLPGETLQYISVVIIDDALVEGVENFKVKLSAAVRATIAYLGIGVGTVIDND